MDTYVWGRIIWPILEDVAWGADTGRRPLIQDEELGNIVADFFASLKDALPCGYCRESYTQFFETTKITTAISESNLVGWVWLLHEMVNEKVGNCSLPLLKLKKRLMSWSQASSAMQVWDVLFLVVYNMPYRPGTETNRIPGIMTFIKTLPYVLGVVPDCPPAEKQLLSSLMLTTPVPQRRGNLEMWRDDWLRWVYILRARYDTTLGFTHCTPTFDQLLSRYRLASA